MGGDGNLKIDFHWPNCISTHNHLPGILSYGNLFLVNDRSFSLANLLSPTLLSPDRKFLSKSLSTPLGEESHTDSNLITTTSLSTGELNMATSEAIKSIHDEMDLLVREGRLVEILLQCFVTPSNSKLINRLRRCCSQLGEDETLRTAITSGQNVRRNG